MNRSVSVGAREGEGADHDRGLQGYYRLHARIYDATRWSFLFGRSRVIELAAGVAPAPRRILEVGCGTGRNLVELGRRFPGAQITGVDLSEAMLAVARKKTAGMGGRVSLVQRAYAAPLDGEGGGYDLVLFSYALSMFNPGCEVALAAAQRDVVVGGHVALVDFHGTRHPWFARWMRVNHVRMERHLRPWLTAGFAPVVNEVAFAYGGVWEYLLYIGRKSDPACPASALSSTMPSGPG